LWRGQMRFRSEARPLSRLLALLTLAVLVTAGCSGGSESAPEQPPTTESVPTESGPQPGTTERTPPTRRPALFTRADLPRLALRPSDAPDGMRYTRAESGAKTLSDAGLILEDQTAEVRRLGFRGLYDSIFDARGSDLRLASRIWLFSGHAGARRWLEKTRSDSTAFALVPFPAPLLADGSWAARGNLGGSDVISHAFRAGNVVVVLAFSTQTVTLSGPDALAAARTAVARVLSR
jgi:hypothetical protein